MQTIRAPRSAATILLTLGMLVALVGLRAHPAQAVPAATTYPGSGVPAEIPDGDTLTSTLAVPPGEPFIDDLDVTVTLTHESADDLDVFLGAPSGTTVELFTDVCATDNRWGEVLIQLDDEGSAPIGTDCPPPPDGQYQPEGLLSAFDGQTPSGEWTLTVTDDTAGGASGELHSWSFTVTPPEPIVVTSAADPGDGVCDADCTLREGITLANADAAGDTIVFNIPAFGVATIAPTTGLPQITSQVIIDGYTQPGSSQNTLEEGNDAVLLIELNGASDSGVPPAFAGLRITAGNSTVRGLVINGFLNPGIRLDTNGGNLVEGNFLGTDASGSAGAGNGGGGIAITSPNNAVGGMVASARNVVSGNGVGIQITGSAATGNMVQGNYIGTSDSGNAGLGNGNAGVSITGASSNTVGGNTAGARNVISGNNGHGVSMFGAGATGNAVEGNYIGTDASGSADLGNTLSGVRIFGASSNSLGGTAAGAGNVISGNDQNGVLITGAGATGNAIQGNYIGTDANGAADLGNSSSGIDVSTLSNTIGGTNSAAGNLISGNGADGVFISGNSNTVQGNHIGTDAAGTGFLGNSGEGISVFDTASSNTIGGTAAGAGNVISANGGGVTISGSNATDNVVQGNDIVDNFSEGVTISEALDSLIGGSATGAGNVIAFNSGTGVMVMGPDVGEAAGNAIRSNSIHSNGELGIDLGNDGVTANDAGDFDGSPNNLQNFPLITGVFGAGGSGVTIKGTLNSAPSTTFQVDLFKNDECDPSRHGEGQTYIGSLEATTDGAGNASFSEAFPVTVPAGSFVTATATDPSGNTSEFSLCNPPPPFVVTNNFDSGGGSLRAAIAAANQSPGPDVIEFDMAFTISHIPVDSPLPAITDPVVIDGTTQPGYSGTPIVELDGINAGANADGLKITAGGTTVKGMVIRGFKGDGIELNGGDGNVIRGNYIGTNLGGTTEDGNSRGIRIVNSANNFIGGTSAGMGNLISGNATRGIAILEDGSTGNVVRGNLIGTDAAGTANLGNGIHGVVVSLDASNNTIGGQGPNTVAFNGDDGVWVESGTGNRVLRNSIHSNGGLGIDLGVDGVTANDTGDEDTGANMLQNFPVLDAAVVGGNATAVFGTLESEADTDYRLHFWHSAACDPSGNGEGQTYLGSKLVSTDGDGLATFRATFAQIAQNRHVTAVAVDPAGNTSEFSGCEQTTLRPTLAISDVTVGEGNSGTTPATFTVTRSGNTGGTSSVNFTTANVTAVAPGDYTTTSGTLSFAAGETTKTITVNVVGDVLDEANETFRVNLSAPVDATISDSQGVGTITDDDPAPTLSISDATVMEPDMGTNKAIFTVTLSAASAQTVTVNFSTADGTATAPADYTATSGTLTFAPGVTTRTISVSAKGENLVEPNETFFVNLTAPANATFGDNQGQGTIQNDD